MFNHGGMFTPTLGRTYVNGHVSYIDWIDIDEFLINALKQMVVKLGYGLDDLMY